MNCAHPCSRRRKVFETYLRFMLSYGTTKEKVLAKREVLNVREVEKTGEMF